MDYDPDNLITFSQAAKISPGRPSANAAWRWARKGLLSRSGRRVRLRHVRAGGRVFTTAEWLTQFFEDVAQADAEHFDQYPHQKLPDMKPSPPGDRRRAIQAAEAQLDAAGI